MNAGKKKLDDCPSGGVGVVFSCVSHRGERLEEIILCHQCCIYVYKTFIDYNSVISTDFIPFYCIYCVIYFVSPYKKIITFININ